MKVIGLSDVGLLIKKIIIGIIVTAIPFLILFGGLRLTMKLLSGSSQPTQVTVNK